ncbi:MAG: helix-turn-helix domain-containing protein [Planctomycetes bacterium]|nr:helix-turn-helix domain-containing protein [Planctomycetota bacterium]
MIAENKPQNDGYDDPTELMTVGDVARSLRLSIRATWRANAAGFLPRPLKVGRATRWRSEELTAWVRAGMPVRSAWEQRQAAQTVGDENT